MKDYKTEFPIWTMRAIVEEDKQGRLNCRLLYAYSGDMIYFVRASTTDSYYKSPGGYFLDSSDNWRSAGSRPFRILREGCKDTSFHNNSSHFYKSAITRILTSLRGEGITSDCDLFQYVKDEDTGEYINDDCYTLTEKVSKIKSLIKNSRKKIAIEVFADDRGCLYFKIDGQEIQVGVTAGCVNLKRCYIMHNNLFTCLSLFDKKENQIRLRGGNKALVFANENEEYIITEVTNIKELNKIKLTAST